MEPSVALRSHVGGWSLTRMSPSSRVPARMAVDVGSSRYDRPILPSDSRRGNTPKRRHSCATSSSRSISPPTIYRLDSRSSRPLAARSATVVHDARSCVVMNGIAPAFARSGASVTSPSRRSPILPSAMRRRNESFGSWPGYMCRESTTPTRAHPSSASALRTG